MSNTSPPTQYAALATSMAELIAAETLPASREVLKRLQTLVGGEIMVRLPRVNSGQPFPIDRVDLLQQGASRTPSTADLAAGPDDVMMVAAGRTVGTLQPSDSVDRGMLTLLAPMLVAEFERWRLVQSQQQEATRRAALARLAISVNAETDLIAVLRTTYTTLYGVLPFEGFIVNIYDAAIEHFPLTFLVDKGEEQLITQPIPTQNNLIGYILRHRTALNFEDMPVDVMHYPEIVPQLAGSGQTPHGWLGVPLVLGDGTITGVISVQAYDATRYTDRDQRFLEQVATNLAVAVQKALLFAERNEQIAVLAAEATLSNQLNTVRDAAGGLAAGLRALSEAFPGRRYVIQLLAPNGTPGLQAWQSTGAAQTITPPMLAPNSYLRHVASTKAPLRITTAAERTQLALGPLTVADPQQPAALSLIAAPLLTPDGSAIGVMAVQAEAQLAFTAKQLDQLQQLARQLVLVLQIIQLLHDRDTQVSELTASYQQQRQLFDLVRELGSPVVPIYPGVLVLPLIGTIDSDRAQIVTERLLEAIVSQQADVVIVDITGVPVVDTGVANYILQAARAVRLLGSTVLLTGISAAVAQTIVQLGVELGDVITCADLAAGLTTALELLGHEIV